MKKTSTGIRLSASDLSDHLSCRHLTTLDMDVAIGGRRAPVWNSPDARILQERGIAHEDTYVEHLKSTGLAAVNFRAFGNDDKLVGETLLAMQAGVDVIVQAAFGDTDWFGRVDVLRRVDKPSRLGSWSYEAYDCKLAYETKAVTILQLSLYSQLVGAAQGLLPDAMYVVPPGETFEPERYRTLDYAAYYRYVKSRLEAVTGANGVGPATYPEPTPHCDICRWQQECDKERRRDDHLSLVAGINKLQRKQLGAWETTTVAGLAAYPLPITERPVHGSRESYKRVREQARVQVAGRESGTPVHEVLQMTDEHGLSLLPEPSPGDVFFDLEGDPFVGPNGREYLFGCALSDGTYESRWGLTADQERDAFVWFVDLVMAKWAEHPGMHIYHYSPYEPSALKRLMGRYGVREDEIDRMLRAKVFIDLHTVIKRSVRASVEQYSLKALEVFHGFARKISLDEAGRAMRALQHSLESARSTPFNDAVKEAIIAYNADDCFSTQSLRDWLERARTHLEDTGHVMARPVGTDGTATPSVSDRQRRSAALGTALKNNVPVDSALRSPDQAASWLLADLLDWHRREVKAEW